MINYKKFDAKTRRPTGKQNCIVWLEDGQKITAYYHQKNESFVGLYNSHKGEVLFDVKEWCYCILPRRLSNDLFPDMIDFLGMRDGLEVFRTQYSVLPDTQQERLFNENDLVMAAINNWVNIYYVEKGENKNE